MLIDEEWTNNLEELYDMKIVDSDLSFRIRNVLLSCGYQTIGDVLAMLENEGITGLRTRARRLHREDIEDFLLFIKKYGFPIEELIDSHIEELKNDGFDSSLEFWINIKEHIECIKLKPLLGMPFGRSVINELGVRYVDDFLEKYPDEKTIPLSQDKKWEIIRRLDKHGYRLKNCPKDRWEHIEEYIQIQRAVDIMIEDLGLPKEIEYTLVSVGITVSKLVSENFEFLQSYFSNREISILLHHLDENNLRMKNIPVWEYTDITEFISQNIVIPIADIGLPKRIVNKLLAHSIENVSALIRYSRQQLIEEKIVSVSSLNEIAQTLLLNKVHLVGDKVCECSRCKTSFAAPQDFEANICLACQERAKRIENARKRNTVVLENPIYYTYEGSFKLAIYATIHNNTEKEFEIRLLDFVVYCANRQWTSTTFIEGYHWEDEVIMPMSAKTIAKTWTHPMWENRRLQDGDYVTFAIEINGSTNSYKFVIRDGSFVLDDYHLLEFKKKP